MSNDNEMSRLWKLQAKVNMMVLDGKRTPKEVADILQSILDTRPAPSYLRLISCGDRLPLPPTNGNRTITSSTNVFGWIDPDFTNYGCNVTADATSETPTVVYEMTKDGTFAALFGDFRRNLDDLCFTQDQIISFVENHPSDLRTGGYGTFFLFKVNGEYFVACVYRYSYVGWGVCVYRLANDRVWGAEDRRRRVVVPQLGALAA